MLTFFTTPKPFEGHIGVIQRNTLRSWTLLHPEAEVILFGDEPGAAEVARELGIRHEPEVRRNEHGTKYLDCIFHRAQEMARHDLLCYANCDILLMSDFCKTVERMASVQRPFLMIGRRWDLDVQEPWDFARPDREAQLRACVLRAGRRRPAQWIDYFVFTRGLYKGGIPSFVVGRPGWDNWLVWHARAAKARVVDASSVVLAVHQNHDYSYHPQGQAGVWHGQEAQRNYDLLDRGRDYATIENATHRLTPHGMRRNYRHWLVLATRRARAAASPAWFALLRLTRPLRHRLGLRPERIAPLFAKNR